MKVKGILNLVLMGFIVSLMFTSVTAALEQQADAELGTPLSHFRFGHLNWMPTGNPNEIVLEADQAVRRDGNCGVGPFTGVGGFPGVGDICVEDQGSTTVFWGDGSDTGTVSIMVTAVDVPGNWLFGKIIDPVTTNSWTHTYGAGGPPGPWTLNINSCCRTSLENNNPSSNYEVSTLVDLNTPPQPNDSPISTTSPIIQCPANAVCTYPIPTADADGDSVMFRLSTGAESGVFTQPGAGGSDGCANALSINSATGQVTWDTTGCTLGLYSNSIYIDEKKSPVAVPHGNVMVDYLIDIVQSTPQNNPPAFDVPPMSPSGTNFAVQVGVPFNAPVECSDVDVADTKTLGNLGLAAGMSVSAQAGGGPGVDATQTFSFTPVAAGVAIVQFTCQDNNGNNAIPHSFTFNISGGGGTPVGGQGIPIDSTMILLAGTQMSAAWCIPAAVAALGIVLGVMIARKED